MVVTLLIGHLFIVAPLSLCIPPKTKMAFVFVGTPIGHLLMGVFHIVGSLLGHISLVVFLIVGSLIWHLLLRAVQIVGSLIRHHKGGFPFFFPLLL